MSNTGQNMAEVSISKESVFQIKKAQLPLHCPLPEMSLWNQHPKVFLPIEESGKASCPYCGTQYILEE